MSLLGNFWKRPRESKTSDKRRRRLFLEPLECRHLLAPIITVDKEATSGTDVIAGQQSTPTFTITVKNDGDDATNVNLTDEIPPEFEIQSFLQEAGGPQWNPPQFGTNPGDDGTVHI